MDSANPILGRVHDGSGTRDVVYQCHSAEAVGGTRTARLSYNADCVSCYPQHEIAVFASHHMARIRDCGIHCDFERLEFPVPDAAYFTD